MSKGNQGHVSGSAALSEAQFHRACAGFLALRLRPPDFFSTFPARWLGGSSGKLQGASLKRLGMKAGMPDIFPLIINGYVYGIELKVGKGTLSDAQHATHALLKLSGGVKDILVCRPSPGNTLSEFVSLLVLMGANLSLVSPSAERMQMAIAAWNRNETKNSTNHDFLIDEFPKGDQIGTRIRSRSLSRSLTVLDSPKGSFKSSAVGE